MKKISIVLTMTRKSIFVACLGFFLVSLLLSLPVILNSQDKAKEVFLKSVDFGTRSDDQCRFARACIETCEPSFFDSKEFKNSAGEESWEKIKWYCKSVLAKGTHSNSCSDKDGNLLWTRDWTFNQKSWNYTCLIKIFKQ